MFEASLVESTGILRTQNRWPAVISIAAQSLLAASLIIIPILHPDILPTHAPRLSFLTPPPRPLPPPPPPPQLLHVTTATTPSLTTPTPTLATTTAPPHHFTSLAPNENAPAISELSMTGGSTTGPFSLSQPAAGSGPNIIATPSPTPGKSTTPLQISHGVSEGHLITPIHPIYPPIAVAAHQQGTVVVEAIISKSGQIESAHATSGPAMLQPAALAAVRQARYHPFLLNGQPTEVATTISINFHLGS